MCKMAFEETRYAGEQPAGIPNRLWLAKCAGDIFAEVQMLFELKDALLILRAS